MKFALRGRLACVGLLLTLISNNARAAKFDWTRAHINTTYAVPHEIGDLYYFWRESGVLANSTVEYSVTADVTVTVGCRVSGLITVTDTYSGPGFLNHPLELTASKRGVLSSSFDFDPPGGGACATGEDRVLLSITYTNATLCDDTNDACTLLSGGTFTQTFCKDGVNPKNCPLF
jgi:hypothetical protein